MAATTPLPPPAPSISTKHPTNTQSCPACGTSVPLDTGDIEDSKRRILELEAQMERLKEKATAAVDRCADYEDQIRSLRIAQDGNRLPRSNTSDSLDPSRPSDERPRPATAGSNTKPSRFSFLTGRRSSPNNSSSLPPPLPPAKDTFPTAPQPTPVDITLLNELERERSLRAKAEARVQKVDIEIEELSVQLFSQANEMVAEERRARAKLEERVETLERRDREKMGRLDRLEKAVSRIDRVKAILNEPAMATTGATLAPPSRK